MAVAPAPDACGEPALQAPLAQADEGAAAGGEAAGKALKAEDQASLAGTEAPSSFPTEGGSSSCCGETKGDSSPMSARSWIYQGEVDLRHGDWEAAERAFGAALELEAEIGVAWAGRGRARLRRGDLQEAARDLDEALQRHPGLAAALSDVSEVKLRLFLAPLDGPALFERGAAKARQGDWDGAVIDLGLAVRLGHPGAQDHLASAKAKMVWEAFCASQEQEEPGP